MYARTRLGDGGDAESPNPVAAASGPASDRALVLPHLLLDEDLEWTEADDGEAWRTFLLLMFTVTLWPLSPLLLLPALGPRRTGVLLGNLALLPQRPWAHNGAAERATRQWATDRSRTFWAHHVTTALYVGAVTAWAFAGGIALPTAPPAAVVTHAMLGFQLLSSGAALLARRLSFASSVIVALHMSSAPRALCRGMCEREVSPTYTVSRAARDVGGGAQRLVYTTTVLFAIDRRLRLRGSRADGSGAAVLSASAYDATRALVRALGLPAPPPLDVVRSQSGRALRLPSGHVVVRATAAPPWRRDVVGALLPPTREASPQVAADDDDVSVDASHLVWLQLLGAGAFARYITVVTACVLVVGVLSVSIPWVVRASLLPPEAVAGTSAAEAAAFVLLTLVDAAAGLSVVSHGGITSTAVYFFVSELVRHVAVRITPTVGSGGGSGAAGERGGDSRGDGDAAGHRASTVQVAGRRHADASEAGSPSHVTFEPMYATALPPPVMAGRGGTCAPAGPATRARLLRSAIAAMPGSVSLDTVEAVLSIHAQLRRLLGNVSPGGLGHGMLSLGFVGPGGSIATTFVLTILFYSTPTAVAAAYPGVDVGLLQQAAIVPTACMLASFATNMGLVLASFLAAGAAIDNLRRIHAGVLQWHLATAGVRAEYAARRSRALSSRAACSGCSSAARFPSQLAVGGASGVATAPHAPSTSMSAGTISDDGDALDAAVGELEAVMDAQRGLLEFVAMAIADGAGIRFLGVFRPGVASVGGLLAVMGSAAALALRLAATAYFSK